MNSLYYIAQYYKESVNDALMQDEISLEQVDALNKIEGDLEDKAIAISHYIRNFESESEMVKTAIKAMQERAKRLDNKVEFLKGYLKMNLLTCGMREIRKSPHFVIKVKTNPPSVIIDDEGLLEKKYFKIKEVATIDKTSISNDIKNGVEVKGAHIEQQTRLEIK